MDKESMGFNKVFVKFTENQWHNEELKSTMRTPVDSECKGGGLEARQALFTKCCQILTRHRESAGEGVYFWRAGQEKLKCVQFECV